MEFLYIFQLYFFFDWYANKNEWKCGCIKPDSVHFEESTIMTVKGAGIKKLALAITRALIMWAEGKDR